MEFEQIQANPLSNLMALVTTLRTRQAEIDALADELKAKEESLKHLKETVLPAEFANLGMTEVTLSTGQRIVVSETVFANISKDRKAAAHAWLRANGAEALVREVLEINGSERVEQARAACIEKNIPFNVDEMVNPAQLKKFVRESLEAGQQIPHDLFGVHIQKSAEIKNK